MQHRDALIEKTESLGGTPIARPEYVVPDYVLASEGAFPETAPARDGPTWGRP